MSIFSRKLTKGGYQFGQTMALGKVQPPSTPPAQPGRPNPGDPNQGAPAHVPGLPPPPAGMNSCVDEANSALRTTGQDHGRVVVITDCFVQEGVRMCSFYFLGEGGLGSEGVYFAPACRGLVITGVEPVPATPGPRFTAAPVKPTYPPRPQPGNTTFTAVPAQPGTPGFQPMTPPGTVGFQPMTPPRPGTPPPRPGTPPQRPGFPPNGKTPRPQPVPRPVTPPGQCVYPGQAEQPQYIQAYHGNCGKRGH